MTEREPEAAPRMGDVVEIEALAERLCDVRANAQDNTLRSWHYIMKNGHAAESWRAVAREAWRLGARVEV